MTELIVREVFKLADQITALACEGAIPDFMLTGKKAVLIDENGIERQEITLIGERKILNSSANKNQRVLETKDLISLTSNDFLQSRWKLVLR